MFSKTSIKLIYIIGNQVVLIYLFVIINLFRVEICDARLESERSESVCFDFEGMEKNNR